MAWKPKKKNPEKKILKNLAISLGRKLQTSPLTLDKVLDFGFLGPETKVGGVGAVPKTERQTPPLPTVWTHLWKMVFPMF